MSNQRTTTVYEPVSGWRLLDTKELWKFRELFWFFAWRDVKVRYKQTALGALWAVLQPFMLMVVFTIFFNRLAGIQSGNVPYPVFVYSGLVLWQLFASSLTSASNSVVGNGSIITKVYFPRLIVPISAMGTAVVDFVAACGMLAVLMWWYGVSPALTLLFLPVPVLLCVVTAIGFGCLVSALNVSYRDFRYTVPFMIQLWLFATPTVYMNLTDSTLADTSEGFQGVLKSVLLYCNPMTSIVGSFRAAVLGQPIPGVMVLSSAATALVVLILGLAVFRRFESRFADIV
jgi:lipopolysaccharide transport system permease protein